MIKFARLNATQQKNLQLMTESEGWRIMKQMIEGSIEINNARLLNWKFNFDEGGEVTSKSIREFRDSQKEVQILKDFLTFIKNPLTIETEKSMKQIYD